MSSLASLICMAGIGVLAAHYLAAAPATTQGAAAAGATPRAAVLAMIDAAGEGRSVAVRHLLYAASEDERMAVDAVTELLVMRARFEKAMRERFGDEAAGAQGVPWLASRADLEQAGQTIDGRRARLILPAPGGGERRLSLVQDAGVWKLSLPEAASAEGVLPLDDPVRRYSDMTEALVEATHGVMRGRYSTAAEASQAAASLVQRAFQGRDSN